MSEPNESEEAAQVDEDLHRTTQQTFRDLAAKQQPLGEPFASILDAERWNLYEQ